MACQGIHRVKFGYRLRRSNHKTKAEHDTIAEISIGIAQLRPDFTKVEDWFHRADTCLYESKKDGRNRTTVKMQCCMPTDSDHGTRLPG